MGFDIQATPVKERVRPCWTPINHKDIYPMYIYTHIHIPEQQQQQQQQKNSFRECPLDLTEIFHKERHSVYAFHNLFDSNQGNKVAGHSRAAWITCATREPILSVIILVVRGHQLKP